MQPIWVASSQDIQYIWPVYPSQSQLVAAHDDLHWINTLVLQTRTRRFPRRCKAPGAFRALQSTSYCVLLCTWSTPHSKHAQSSHAYETDMLYMTSRAGPLIAYSFRFVLFLGNRKNHVGYVGHVTHDTVLCSRSFLGWLGIRRVAAQYSKFEHHASSERRGYEWCLQGKAGLDTKDRSRRGMGLSRGWNACNLLQLELVCPFDVWGAGDQVVTSIGQQCAVRLRYPCGPGAACQEALLVQLHRPCQRRAKGVCQVGACVRPGSMRMALRIHAHLVAGLSV